MARGKHFSGLIRDHTTEPPVTSREGLLKVAPGEIQVSVGKVHRAPLTPVFWEEPRKAMIQFLYSREVWRAISDLARRPARIRAAISYFGKGGAGRLPLKAGDELIVDMSTQALRQGLTDPREIRKLMRDRVHVYSRSLLHAKFILGAGWLITGSANVSRNSEEFLEEAAIRTDSPSAYRAAAAAFKKWRTEPVFEGRLREALKEYREPRFKGLRTVTLRRPTSKAQAGRARLWIVVGLRHIELKGEEKARADAAKRKALKGFRRRSGKSTSYIRYFKVPRLLGAVRRNDWVIQEVDGYVFPPARVAGKRSYRTPGKGVRWLVVVEEWDRDSTLTWARFRRVARRILGKHFGASKRTKGVRPDTKANELSSLWSPRTGRPLKKAFS
jgi:hypothetical protein